MKKIIRFAIYGFLALLLVMTDARSVDAKAGYVKSLYVDTNEHLGEAIKEGSTKAIKVKVKVSGKASKDVTVKSSNTGVAKVKYDKKTKKIKVTGVKGGNTKIQITTKGKGMNGKKFSIKVPIVVYDKTPVVVTEPYDATTYDDIPTEGMAYYTTTVYFNSTKKNVVAKYTYSQITLETDNPALSKFIEDFNKKEKIGATSIEDYSEEEYQNALYVGWGETRVAQIVRNDEKVFSVLVEGSGSYGADSSLFYEGYNFDVANQKEVTFDDVVLVDKEELSRDLEELIVDKYPDYVEALEKQDEFLEDIEEYTPYNIQEEIYKRLIDEEYPYKGFVLTDSGVNFGFEYIFPFTVAGTSTVDYDYSPDVFAGKYF